MENNIETTTQKNKKHNAHPNPTMNDQTIHDQLILTEIITRVPIRSATRFKCVSKPWRAEISSPEFIKLRLQRPSLEHGIIVQADSSIYTVLNYALCDGTNTTDFKKVKVKWDHLMSPNPFLSCNGLVCTMFDKERVCIWNPRLKNKIVYVRHAALKHVGPSLWGFGYVRSLDAFKIVKFCRTKAHVFSFKSFEWKEIETASRVLGSHASFSSDSDSGVYLGTGKYYWIMRSYDDNMRCNGAIVLAFDFATESFDVVQLPECFNGNGGRTLRSNACVGSINDQSLCIASQGSDPKLQVWVLQCNGDSMSWSRVMENLGNKMSPATGKLRSFNAYGVGKADNHNIMVHMNGQLWLIFWGSNEYNYALLAYHTFHARPYVESEVAPSMYCSAASS